MGKGVPNKTSLVKKVAEQLVHRLIMEQTELLARLTRIGRADLGQHLEFDADGKTPRTRTRSATSR